MCFVNTASLADPWDSHDLGATACGWKPHGRDAAAKAATVNFAVVHPRSRLPGHGDTTRLKCNQMVVDNRAAVTTRPSASDTNFDAIFGALAHPTRRAILSRLRQGPASVSELCEPFHVSQQAISKQIAVLRKAGLVTQLKQGRESRCMLCTMPLEHADRWLQFYRPLWNERFDRLAEYLDRPANDG